MTEKNYNMPTKDDLEKIGDKNLDEAEKGDYDLIIMGSRGLGTFSRTILGSISNKVLNHVKVNVLIVK